MPLVGLKANGDGGGGRRVWDLLMSASDITICFVKSLALPVDQMAFVRQDVNVQSSSTTIIDRSAGSAKDFTKQILIPLALIY